MLRTLLVLGVFAIGLRYAVRGPFYVLLLYLWVAYFRPEYWMWHDFLLRIDPSFWLGVWLVGATPFAGKRMPIGLGPILLAAFLLQSALSTYLSDVFPGMPPSWLQFVRVVVVSYCMQVHITDEKRLRLVLLVIGWSLAFEGAKQGWVEMIRSPGALNRNTLPHLGDNNGVAVGMLMLAPILLALAATSRFRSEKYLDRFLVVGVIYRAVTTYSRGAFLATGSLALHYLLHAKRRVRAFLAVVAVGALVVSLLPDSFWDRMRTIDVTTGEAEYSALGRLHFWQVAADIARDHPGFGVGHDGYSLVYDRYDTSNGFYGRGRAVHSTWFGVLAEYGYTGLVLFVSIFLVCLATCWVVRFRARRHPEYRELARFASGVEAALVVYAVGGTFVTFQYNEMYWHFVALAMTIGRLAHEVPATVEASNEPAVSAVPLPAPAHVAASGARVPRAR